MGRDAPAAETGDPNESPVHAFARIIIDGRRAAGWSRARLATEVNFGATYIGEGERAEKLPTLDVALSIARTLDLDCDVVEKAWNGANAHLHGTSAVGPVTEPLRTERRSDEPAMVPPDERPSFKRSWGVMVVGGLVLVLAVVMFVVARPDEERPSGPTAAPASAQGTRPTTPPSSTTVPTTTTRPSGTFSDDFTTDGGWFVADNSNALAAVADGQYRFVVRKQASEYLAAEPRGSTASSQRVEVDAERITSGRLTYGVYGCWRPSMPWGSGRGTSAWSSRPSTSPSRSASTTSSARSCEPTQDRPVAGGAYPGRLRRRHRSAEVGRADRHLPRHDDRKFDDDVDDAACRHDSQQHRHDGATPPPHR